MRKMLAGLNGSPPHVPFPVIRLIPPQTVIDPKTIQQYTIHTAVQCTHPKCNTMFYQLPIECASGRWCDDHTTCVNHTPDVNCCECDALIHKDTCVAIKQFKPLEYTCFNCSLFHDGDNGSDDDCGSSSSDKDD